MVANAGLGVVGALADATQEDYDLVLGVNVDGTVLTVQKALPLPAEGASVVLLGSTTGVQGVAGMGLYAASKAAIRSPGRTWAAELAPRGVRG